MTLKPEHLPHLANLAFGGLIRTKTPDDIAEHLIKNGYAKKVMGGLVATDTAQQVLIQQGFKPKVWQ